MSVDLTTGDISDALTDDEYADLEALETTISKGLDTFVEVGNALAEIRDRKLYRQYHATFDAYCKKQWEIGRHRAYQLIHAADVVTDLSTSVNTPLPTNEAQARELGKVDPAKRAAVMAKAAEGGPPTAPKIRDAAADLDPTEKERREKDEWRAKRKAEQDAAKKEADAVMAQRIAERRQHDPRVRAEHINQTVRGFLLSDAHTLLDINPTEAAESLPLGDELSAVADAERLRDWLTTFIEDATRVAPVTDLRSVQ